MGVSWSNTCGIMWDIYFLGLAVIKDEDMLWYLYILYDIVIGQYLIIGHLNGRMNILDILPAMLIEHSVLTHAHLVTTMYRTKVESTHKQACDSLESCKTATPFPRSVAPFFLYFLKDLASASNAVRNAHVTRWWYSIRLTPAATERKNVEMAPGQSYRWSIRLQDL